MNKRKILSATALAIAASALVGCGPAANQSPNPLSSAPGGQIQFGNQSNGPGVTSSTNVPSYIFATYGGTLERGELALDGQTVNNWQGFGYTYIIKQIASDSPCKQVQGAAAELEIEIASNPPVHVGACAQYTTNSAYPGTHGIGSSVMILDDFYESPVVIETYLTYSGSSQVPTQAQVRIWECVFTQGLNCTQSKQLRVQSLSKR